MIVRFDPKKLQHNTMADIGVEHDGEKEKGISEVEMLVSEARRHSTSVREGAVEDADESDQLRDQVIREQEEEEQEPGPELTPEGKDEADRILAEKRQAGGSQAPDSKDGATAPSSTS